MFGNLLQGVPIRIVESTAACTYTPRRTYAKRRARSPRHRARMSKKWAKRYGWRAVPQAYWMNTSHLLGATGGQVLVVHPMLAHEYRKAINAAFKPAGPANYPGENWL